MIISENENIYLQSGKFVDARGLGEKIRNRRKKLGYTQIQLARMCNCSPRYIGDLENGKAGGTLKQLLKICHSIGIDLYAKERG